MRTWASYLSAALMGLAAAYLFSGSAGMLEVMEAACSFLINLGLCLSLLVLPFTFTAGIASLGRYNEGRKVFSSCLLWTIVTSLALSLLSAPVFYFLPVSFPVTGTSSLAPGTLDATVTRMLSNAGSALSMRNPVWTACTTLGFLPPLLLVLLAVGIAAVPKSDVIRPAYTVLNSLSEVMHRVSRTYAVFGFILVFFSSSVFFLGLSTDGTLLTNLWFTSVLSLSAFAALIVVLPLLFALFTGFRRNPYKILLRSLPALLSGLFSSNSAAAIAVEEALCRNSIGTQKKVSSVSVPFLTVIGKGGTAFISSLAVLSIISATTGSMLDTTSLLLVSLASFASSFLSTAAAGAEPALVTVLVLRILGVELYGAENALVALLPFITGLGLLLDSYITMLGTVLAAHRLGAVYELGYEDIL